MSAVRQDAAVMKLCDRETVIKESIIGGKMAGERPMSETKMIESHFLETTRNSIENIEDRIEVAKDGEVDCGQELLERSCYRHGHISLKPL